MDWGFVFLMLGLKIPLAALCWLVWWAIKQTPDEAEQPHGQDDGGSKVPHPRGPLPRHPRRGPHGDPLPDAPSRVRTVVVRVGTPER
jgi:hypothetical protein